MTIAPVAPRRHRDETRAFVEPSFLYAMQARGRHEDTIREVRALFNLVDEKQNARKWPMGLKQ